MNNRILLSLCVAAAGHGMSCLADDGDRLGAAAQFVRPFFDRLDCENVGFVEPEEATDHAHPAFLKFDLDRSRAVDRREWLAYPLMRDKELLEISFELADRDGDGGVDVDEFIDYMRDAIVILDADGDREVHWEELERHLRPESRTPEPAVATMDEHSPE
jgi:Ca2+-binding EF-hand superfamily protein